MIRFDDKGLVPVVVQDELTGLVRMVAYANALAVDVVEHHARLGHGTGNAARE